MGVLLCLASSLLSGPTWSRDRSSQAYSDSTGPFGGLPLSPSTMPQFAVTPSKVIDYFFNALTTDKIAKMSGGKIPKMTKEQASGLIGSWIVETGNPSLNNLDVVEKGAGAGRGLSQYTGARRVAYDKARAAALANGQDPNTPQWQLQYFVNEYTGKHDPAPGKSLIGWTRVFENAPAKGSAADFARYYTGSAASGKGYFRPGVPHTAGRQDAASQVMRLYGSARPQQVQQVQPPRPTVTPAPQAKPAASQNPFANLSIPQLPNIKSWFGF